MKIRTTASSLVVNRTVLPDPAFIQKYSHEVRDRIAKKAYDLFEQRGQLAGRDRKTGSRRKNSSARRWMKPVSERVLLLLKSAFDAVVVMALLTGGVVLPGLQKGGQYLWGPHSLAQQRLHGRADGSL